MHVLALGARRHQLQYCLALPYCHLLCVPLVPRGAARCHIAISVASTCCVPYMLPLVPRGAAVVSTLAAEATNAFTRFRNIRRCNSGLAEHRMSGPHIDGHFFIIACANAVMRPCVMLVVLLSAFVVLPCVCGGVKPVATSGVITVGSRSGSRVASARVSTWLPIGVKPVGTSHYAR